MAKLVSMMRVCPHPRDLPSWGWGEGGSSTDTQYFLGCIFSWQKFHSWAGRVIFVCLHLYFVYNLCCGMTCRFRTLGDRKYFIFVLSWITGMVSLNLDVFIFYCIFWTLDMDIIRPIISTWTNWARYCGIIVVVIHTIIAALIVCYSYIYSPNYLVLSSESRHQNNKASLALQIFCSPVLWLMLP